MRMAKRSLSRGYSCKFLELFFYLLLLNRERLAGSEPNRVSHKRFASNHRRRNLQVHILMPPCARWLWPNVRFESIKGCMHAKPARTNIATSWQSWYLLPQLLLSCDWHNSLAPRAARLRQLSQIGALQLAAHGEQQIDGH